MARKKRGGRRGGMLVKARGFVRTGVNLTFKVVGAIVALSPTYRGLKNVAGGNIEAGAADILYDTTGISSGTGPDIGQVAKTVVTVGGGLFIAWLGGQVARHL